LLFLFLFLFLFVPTPMNNRFIQGTPAAVDEFPYFATYGDYENNSFCGGALIYADIILSECVVTGDRTMMPL
jgi:hypothetical protein